jgi:hypothetical protein
MDSVTWYVRPTLLDKKKKNLSGINVTRTLYSDELRSY